METFTSSLNKHDKISFERRIDSVVVAQGKLVVSDGDNSTTVSSHETYEAKGSTTVTLIALEATNFAVHFSENAVAVS